MSHERKVGGRFPAILLALVMSFSLSVAAQSHGASSQENLPDVPAEQAKDNLITFVQPDYPPLAKAARIVGIVHASFEIDETGSVTDLKLISGHPMLAPAALQAIRKWKCKPFLVGGKVAAVRTEVQVAIPENVTQSDIDRERKFQDAYWMNERAGRAALDKGDLATAETKLLLARVAAEERGDAKWLELADVVTMLGDIKERREDYSGAEGLLTESLSIHRKHQRPDEAEVAGSEFNLAALYVRMGRLAEAEPLLLDAAKVWELRIADTPLPEPRASYSKHLALSYIAAARIAAEDGRLTDAQSRCQKALGFAEQSPDHQYVNDIRSECSSLLQAH